MWNCPISYDRNAKEIIPIHQSLDKLKGELDEEQAKITLAQFLRAHLGFTTELLCGIQLAAIQRILIRAFFNRNFSLIIASRGFGKTFLAAIFSILYAIFEPGTKVVVAGPSFRTARRIFDEIERIVMSREAELLAQVFNVELKTKRNDENKWIVDDGYIIAIPLSGDKLRGFRASVLILDEFLLLSENLIKNVLMPFLVSPQDMKRRLRIRREEERLIKDGKLSREQMTKFTNNAKMIALSSASYTFENLYTTYQDWIAKMFAEDNGLLDTEDEKTIIGATYFVGQLSFESLPEHMIDQNIIIEAQSGGKENPSFLREYCARFTDGSEGFYSAKKMNDCTIPDGEDPTTKIVGDPDKNYILSIDPNADDSPTSDFFAMCVLELDDEKEEPTIVHNFGEAGAGLKRHIEYLFYLLKSFNIVLIVLDHAGGQNFINSANESELFQQNKINLRFFDYNSDLETIDNQEAYEKMIMEAKSKYNPGDGTMCFNQYFSENFIRGSNTHLQKLINIKKMWFASKVRANSEALNKYMEKNIPLSFTQEKGVSEEDSRKRGVLDHIEEQDIWIHNLKKQCSLIEVTTTVKGTQQYNLPQHLRREKGKNRARKDNYTALLLGTWAHSIYYKLLKQTKKVKRFQSFAPTVIK